MHWSRCRKFLSGKIINSGGGGLGLWETLGGSGKNVFLSFGEVRSHRFVFLYIGNTPAVLDLYVNFRSEGPRTAGRAKAVGKFVAITNYICSMVPRPFLSGAKGLARMQVSIRYIGEGTE